MADETEANRRGKYSLTVTMRVAEYKKLGPVDDLVTLIERARLPIPEREYAFHADRKWRADLAWPDRKVIVEVEGGTWNYGAHVRGRHFADDCIKYNAATMAGWSVYRLTPDMIRGEYGIALVREILR